MGYRDYLLKEEAKDLNVPPALARKLAELVKFGLLEKGSKMINKYIANTGMTVEEHEEAIHKMLDAAANAIESSGWICLQSEGSPIAFRNIYIELLD